MRGDYSRETFRPKRHFSSVRQQQGRVALDADWNEYTAIQDRRWRIETQDIIGRCGVPEEAADSFRITESGGDLLVGPGRIYVDGLLAENHGEAPLVFLPHLEEVYGTAPVSLQDQPYSDQPIRRLPPGRHMLYVDVWRREVAHRQQDGLIEPAVGVDTTTREQTIWQVRLLQDVGDLDCSTPLVEFPGWAPVNEHSGARLSSRTVDVDIQEDPCIIPPSGGYRGLENQLYRIEVHDAPAQGAVRIKWSRDNATVSASILRVFPGAELVQLDQVGKDAVLSFKSGDWVEITNNVRELAGVPGEMRQVVVDEGDKTLAFVGALPADLTANVLANKLRVVRWDQSENLDADGLIPLADGEAVELEAGIQVTINMLAGLRGRTGDFWCIAARAVGTSIEILDREPPRGIHHHYCKLAIVEVDNNNQISITDCRPTFPPLTRLDSGCCTAVVSPGESIQAAIDSLPPEGGCVCVKTGDHEVNEPIRIRQSNISLHGESPGARIIRRNGASILDVGSDEFADISDVHIQRLTFDIQFTDDTFQSSIAFRRARDSSFMDCDVLEPARSFNLGLVFSRCLNVNAKGNRIQNAMIGIWAGADSSALRVAHNTVDSEFQRDDRSIVAIWLADSFGASCIERNTIEGYLNGIVLNSQLGDWQKAPRSGARGSRILANRIRLRGLNDFETEQQVYAIDVAAGNCEVRSNYILFDANWQVAIRVTAERPMIAANTVWSLFDQDGIPESLPIGIQHERHELASNLVASGVIADNTLIGPQHAISVARTIDSRITGNSVRGLNQTPSLAITTEGVVSIRISENDISDTAFGIACSQGDGVAIDHRIDANTIRNCIGGITLDAISHASVTRNSILASQNMAIIAVGTTNELQMDGNRIRYSGYSVDTAYGVLIFIHQGLLRFCDNEVIDTGASPNNKDVADIAVGVRAEFVRECTLDNNRIAYESSAMPSPQSESRAVMIRGFLESRVSVGDRDVFLGYPVRVTGNHFHGPGQSALFEINESQLTDTVFRRFERVIVANNTFDHSLARVTDGAATLQIHGRRSICQGNDFKSAVNVPSVNFHNVQSTYIGNAAMQAPINFVGKPAVLDDFNLQ